MEKSVLAGCRGRKRRRIKVDRVGSRNKQVEWELSSSSWLRTPALKAGIHVAGPRNVVSRPVSYQNNQFLLSSLSFLFSPYFSNFPPSLQTLENRVAPSIRFLSESIYSKAKVTRFGSPSKDFLNSIVFSKQRITCRRYRVNWMEIHDEPRGFSARASFTAEKLKLENHNPPSGLFQGNSTFLTTSSKFQRKTKK